MQRRVKRSVRSVLPLGLLALLACGRASLDLPNDGSGGNGGGSSSSKSSSGSTMTTSTTASSMNSSTTGSGGSCSVAQECEDNDPCTSNKCEGGVCQFPPRDDDGDGAISTQCGGFDCNDLNPNAFPGHPEDCFDGDDNDCNGVADCLWDPLESTCRHASLSIL